MTTVVTTDRPLQSLLWSGDELVDVLGGSSIVGQDGSVANRRLFWSYAFDRVSGLAGSPLVLLVKLDATKGVLYEDGRIVREIDRSFYHADITEFPATLARRPDGREVLVHCPDDYNRLEVEDARTGERLTTRASASPDFFHSRLAVSPGGRHLLSAGWYWHPVAEVHVFDLDRALSEPTHLDERGRALPCAAETVAACWLDDDRIA